MKFKIGHYPAPGARGKNDHSGPRPEGRGGRRREERRRKKKKEEERGRKREKDTI